jgi:hypothetical protein
MSIRRERTEAYVRRHKDLKRSDHGEEAHLTRQLASRKILVKKAYLVDVRDVPIHHFTLEGFEDDGGV